LTDDQPERTPDCPRAEQAITLSDSDSAKQSLCGPILAVAESYQAWPEETGCQTRPNGLTCGVVGEVLIGAVKAEADNAAGRAPQSSRSGEGAAKLASSYVSAL
jgi:hypothetical protein